MRGLVLRLPGLHSRLERAVMAERIGAEGAIGRR